MFFFFKQKTAYEMRISDWSSDVCSSDLWTNEKGVAMKVFVAGATGALGKQLVPLLVAKRHDVVGMTRTDAKRDQLHSVGAQPVRSEERRVGKECVSTCRSRWSPYQQNTNQHHSSRLTSKL